MKTYNGKKINNAGLIVKIFFCIAHKTIISYQNTESVEIETVGIETLSVSCCFEGKQPSGLGHLAAFVK